MSIVSSPPPAPFDAERFLKSIGNDPGIYQMYDSRGEVLYVGKARQLKKRLASYFRSSGVSPKTASLVSKIADIQVTLTNTEAEALLLEQNLIKQWRPPYNILLRDDKSYPYIFLSTDHPYPRLSFHRGTKKKRGRYFGPFPSSGAVRESLNFLQKAFRVRQCEDSFYNNRSRPCLQYQIGRCTGPCVGLIDREQYAEDVRHTTMFLEGKSSDLIDELAQEMERASAELAFEDAAEYRDKIQYLQQVQARQYIEGEAGDLDIIACAIAAGVAAVQVLYVREGRILGSKSYFPKCPLDQSESEVIAAFIAQRYLGGSSMDLPRELLVSHAPQDRDSLVEAVSAAAGRKLGISHNLRAERAKWLQLAATTAAQNLSSHLAHKQSLYQRFVALQEALALPEMPERLECFDISHSHGEATVASCVVFDSNGPLKSDYRLFNIKDVTPGDDYAAMHQALTRRYKKLKTGEGKLPDILFIDGGKGQVAKAREVLDELQLVDVLLIGVGKGVERRAGLETLYRGDTGQSLSLPADSPALHLIQHIRDESHRFAVTGHKQRRDKSRRRSPLEGIAGVGPKRRRELLRHFGGWQGVRQASVDDLCRVPGISKVLADQIHAALREA